MRILDLARRLPLSRAVLFLIGNSAAQGLAALSGLLLARWLSVDEYGLYTIITVVMGALSILTKGGTHLGFTAILGRTWPDPRRAFEALEAAIRTRKIISVAVLPPVILTSLAMLLENGATQYQAAFAVISLMMFWWGDIRSRVIDQVLNFASKTTPVQILEVILSLFRLFAIAILYYVNILDFVSAITVAGLVSILRVRPIVMWVRELLPKGARPKPRAADMEEIKRAVFRQLPVDLYYVMQSHSILIVLSVFSSVETIAAFGALTRIGQLMLPVEAFTYAFFVPAFAVAKRRIFALWIYFVTMTMVPGLLLVAVAYCCPNALLWLVGEKYARYETELLVLMIVVTASRGAQTSWALLAHRGLVDHSWVQIPSGISVFVILLCMLDVGQMRNIVLLQSAFAFGFIVAAALELFGARHRIELFRR